MQLVGKAKFRAIAVELEALVAAGKWSPSQKLPSVRKIAKKYNVALATAARALEFLHGKGIIRPHERSGVYLVVDAASHATEQWAVCLRVTPGPWQRASRGVTESGFLALAHTPGIHLFFDAVPTDLDLADAALKKMVHKAMASGISGLFFMPSRFSEELMKQDERFLSICRECAWPVVLIERNLRGEHRALEWDLVCPDDVDGGFQGALHLFESGRKNLCFIRGGPTSSHNDQLAGFLAAHFEAQRRRLLPGKPAFPLILDYPENSSSKDAYRTLVGQIVQNHIDGVVCYHDRAVIGLAIELMARGKRIPDDVALTGFDDQPIGQEFSIGVTTYAYPGQVLAARSFEVMRERIKDPAAPPIKVLIPSRLIVRDSSAGVAQNSG